MLDSLKMIYLFILFSVYLLFFLSMNYLLIENVPEKTNKWFSERNKMRWVNGPYARCKALPTQVYTADCNNHLIF